MIATHTAMTIVALVPVGKAEIKGLAERWASMDSSGNAVHRIFCSECGSPIVHDPDAALDIIAMKLEILNVEN
jgi:hypothetical protein